MKVCRRCQTAKPLSDFNRDARYRDGHGSWCKQCHRDRNSSWAKENRVRLNAKAIQWRAENPEAARMANVTHKRANKERLAIAHAEWVKSNRDKRRATDAKHRSLKRRATPSWADPEKIAAIYRRALEIERATGQRMHVDHIIPLNHPLVCGLHCEANLQIIPGPENESKRNRFEPFIEKPKPAVQEALEL